jgi:hypothetical protein
MDNVLCGVLLVSMSLAGVCGPSPAVAQVVGRPSVAFSVGGATFRGGEYSHRDVMLTGATGTVQFRSPWRGISAIVGMNIEQYFATGDQIGLCVLGSRGQCLGEFPDATRMTGALGARYELGRVFSSEASFGGGYFGASGSRARFVRLNLGLEPIPHVGLGVQFERLDLPEFGGAHVSATPFSVVIRIH